MEPRSIKPEGTTRLEQRFPMNYLLDNGAKIIPLDIFRRKSKLY